MRMIWYLLGLLETVYGGFAVRLGERGIKKLIYKIITSKMFVNIQVSRQGLDLFEINFLLQFHQTLTYML